MRYIKNNKKGFTVVEMLIVLLILGILASVVLTSVGSARIRVRDAQRKSDMGQIQKGLELYQSSHNGQYPAEDWCDSSVGSCASACPCNTDTNWNYVNASFIGPKFRADGLVNDLMVDPVNNSTYFYWYEPECNQNACVGKGCCAYTIGTRLEENGAAYTLSGSSGI